MLQIVWTYRVRAEKARDFEAYYRATGDWANFFRKGKGYMRTELLRDRDDPLRFATVDVWSDFAAYEKFKAEHAAEYKERDAHCSAFTEDEQFIGYFENVDTDPVSTRRP